MQSFISERSSSLPLNCFLSLSLRKCKHLDTGMEDLDLNDRMSDLLGPKRLDFEVIDFDQFGAQPPDLPLNNNLARANHHGGMSSSNGGKGIDAVTKAKKPEHHVRVLDARNEFEHGGLFFSGLW